jgi:CO dehydrogenase maturation factor
LSTEQLLGSAEFGDATVIADLEAGIGTLTRLPEGAVDAVLVVVEPTSKSIDVGARAAELARSKGVAHIHVVANRVRGEADVDTIRAAFPDAVVTSVPDDAAVVAAERAGAAPLDTAPDAPAVRALVALAQQLGAA